MTRERKIFLSLHRNKSHQSQVITIDPFYGQPKLLEHQLATPITIFELRLSGCTLIITIAS